MPLEILELLDGPNGAANVRQYLSGGGGLEVRDESGHKNLWHRFILTSQKFYGERDDLDFERKLVEGVRRAFKDQDERVRR